MIAMALTSSRSHPHNEEAPGFSNVFPRGFLLCHGLFNGLYVMSQAFEVFYD